MTTDHEFDVVVVGGGPAGSSTAGLLRLAGHSVALVEREKFPRYHIGESLITGVWPTIKELGLVERLENAGFQRKYGASLLWGLDGREVSKPWSFKFRDATQYDHAFQVRRADFDALLLSHARELGVTVIEDAAVKEPLFDGDRMVGLTYQMRGESEATEIRARIVVDASGQQRWLGRHFDIVDWHEDLRNIAVWTYYQGCERLPGEDSGNILTENRPDGWIWFIPLADGSTSIGYVTPMEAMAESGLTPQEMFDKQLSESAVAGKMARGGRRVSTYRTFRDWSYTCRNFSGPGWVLVGDAAAFIDPLLSTGVTLAMRGARTLAPAVHKALTDPAAEEESLGGYESGYKDFLGGLLDFVRFFYDQNKRRDEYDQGAQAIIDPRRVHSARADFITLVSGLGPEERGVPLSGGLLNRQVPSEEATV